jgi:tetratricopeptide (TPR) repeat protein
MGRKPIPVNVSQASAGAKDRAATATLAAEGKPRRPHGRRLRVKVFAVLIVIGAAGALYLTYEHFRVIRLARAVRQSFAARHIAESRALLQRWLAIQPGSAEAHYYKAWAAMAADQLGEAFQEIEQAGKLGYDQTSLDCLSAIGQSRTERFNEAEPGLEQAFREHREPKDMVAKELARIYLSTYRLEAAASAIEQWRTLAPEDPQPYMWSNEVLARSDDEPAIAIQNYRAALERDPNLDKARLGLAQQLGKARRYDEAEQEYRTYLKHKPDDSTALLGLGRNAFLQGDIDAARKYFESAVKANPRQSDALKELGQIDLRLGRFQQACETLERLTQIDPFDAEARYTYAQALKLSGDDTRARVELAQAARLRKENDEIVDLRNALVKEPNNLNARFQVTKWMFDHGHRDEGLKWTKEILRADPRHVPTHKLLAEYYATQGDAGLASYHRVMATAGQDTGR